MEEKNTTDFILEDGVTLLDFFAPWCNPCKSLTPIIDELTDEYKINSDVRIVKINVDENPEIAHMYQIKGIPSMVLLKNTEVVNKLIGLQEKQTIKNFIEEVRISKN
jgi:thioredoxin 1